MDYVKEKIDFYKDFPITGVEYIDLNPVYKDPKARKIIVEKCISLIEKVEFDWKDCVRSGMVRDYLMTKEKMVKDNTVNIPK